MRKQNFNFFLLCFVVAITGCASSLDQKAMLLGFGDEKMVPRAPIIFLPGLGCEGWFWYKGKIFKKLEEFGYTFGGDLKVEDKDGKLIVQPEEITSAHMYTVTFSGIQLPIVEQGREVAEVVKKVRAATGSKKVTLVGHSMGGLAARE